MRLNGIHHITGITSDGQRCLDFYAGILGLAFLGRDPDFESPDSHLIRLGHQHGRPDEAIAFIEAPGVGRGRAGNGMVHSLRWSVRSPSALGYWAERLRPNVFVASFKEMKRDLRSTVVKVAHFLNIRVPDAVIDESLRRPPILLR